MYNTIKFTIGSFFQGEGFNKARQAVNSVNNDIKKGMSSANALAGAFSSMDGAASKTLNALTGLVGAIATFNLTSIASQVMMTGINMYFGEMKEKAEEAKKAAEALKESMNRAFSNAMSSRISDFNKEVKQIEDDFNRITKQANDFTAALEGVRAAEANGGIISLQVEKLNALLEAHSEEQRANIEAAYNLKIAIQKSANIETEWQVKIDAAHQAVIDSTNKISIIDNQIAKVQEERAELESVAMAAKANHDAHWIEVQKRVNALKDQEEDLERKKIEAEGEIAILREKEKKTKQDSENAQAAATQGILEVQLANKKLAETIHRQRVAAEEKFEADWLNKQATIEDTNAKKTAAEIQDEVNKSASELRKAQDAYSEALKKYHESGAGLRNGQQSYGDYVKQGGDIAVADALKEGVRAVQDLQRAARFGERASRDRANAEKRAARDADTANKIAAKNQKLLTKWDKDFMDKYNKAQEADNRDQSEFDAATLAMQNAEQHLSDIKDKLGLLGLK